MGHLMALRGSEQPPSHRPLIPCDQGIVVIPRFTRTKSILIAPADFVHSLPFASTNKERERVTMHFSQQRCFKLPYWATQYRMGAREFGLGFDTLLDR